MIDMFMGEYRWLSNFHEAPILYDGRVYRNNEAAYQSQKTFDKSTRWVFTFIDGKKARKAGQELEIRPDWNAIRVQIMKEVTHAKYDQHIGLRDLLLLTDDQELIEGNWWNDTFWGVCRGVGENNLGKILMAERAYWRYGPEHRYEGLVPPMPGVE